MRSLSCSVRARIDISARDLHWLELWQKEDPDFAEHIERAVEYRRKVGIEFEKLVN